MVFRCVGRCGGGLGGCGGRAAEYLDRLSGGGLFPVGAQVLPNFVLAPDSGACLYGLAGLAAGRGWNGGQWQFVVLPVIALATSYLASIARIMRSSMLEVLNAGFIRTARAKGLPTRQILWRHALKPALLPLLSYLGPAFVFMITGSFVIDIYFSTGGIGHFFRQLGVEPRLFGDHGHHDPGGRADHPLRPCRRSALRLDRTQDQVLTPWHLSHAPPPIHLPRRRGRSLWADARRRVCP